MMVLGLILVAAAAFTAAAATADASAAGGSSDSSQAGSTQADSVGTTTSTPADSTGEGTAQEAGASMSAIIAAAHQQEEELAAAGPLLVSWSREPKAGLRAKVRKVEFYGHFKNNLVLAGQAGVDQELSYLTEEYRKQDKTVEKRDGSLIFRGGQTLPVNTQIHTNWNWSEDRTVNTAGSVNLIKRDYKQARVVLNKNEIVTGPVTHSFALNGAIDDQKGETQGRRNDMSNGNLSGAVRSRFAPWEGLAVTTSLWEQRGEGERTLGESTSASASDADSLGGGVHFKRGRWQGSFSARRSSFNRRYLDYRRNSNGIIDTVGVGEAEKIVEELERKDAVTLAWKNKLRFGRLGLSTVLSRDMQEQDYRFSGVGKKERLNDKFKTDLSFRYGAKDSVKVMYDYGWTWDDQTYKGATSSRGRQINQKRSFDLTVLQSLFRHTNATFKYQESLIQDTAENQFNKNDRDRLETQTSLKLSSDWPARFRATMIFSYRHIEDISLRESRSANNNIKETYEITPGYVWPLAPWLDVTQDFRISIQFTDYVFSDMEQVTREDDYNKRGNLTTRVSLRPGPRLKLTVTHDYNAKFNATRTRTDASGNRFYSRDLEQRISTIDLSLTYKATDWLKLEGASYRTKDLKDSFGNRISSTDVRSGEIWLGCVVNKSWGARKERTLAATVRKYNAHGPNVQESNARYWDADASFTWKF